MIIIQTPLRVSLFGGGTDFPSYYLEEGGCVLNFSIDKYIFVAIKKRFDKLLRVGYTRTEMVEDLDDIEHELIRESLRKTGLTRGIEVTTMGDIPSAGSGLGSSSTVTVGALHAMYSYLGEHVLSERLAREACEIEIETLKKPIGVQDQYIAAYGGVRFMEFLPGGEIICNRLELSPKTLRGLAENLLLFYTGITRKSDTILKEQQSNIDDRRKILRRLKEMAVDAREQLTMGNLDVVGCLLDEAWHEKKKMASRISNGRIDDLYAGAIAAGALGGKITGAGGGGFLLVYCPEGKRDSVRRALADLQELPFQIEPDGSKVIFNYRR